MRSAGLSTVFAQSRLSKPVNTNSIEYEYYVENSAQNTVRYRRKQNVLLYTDRAVYRCNYIGFILLFLKMTTDKSGDTAGAAR